MSNVVTISGVKKLYKMGSETVAALNGVDLKNVTGHIGATSDSVVLDDVKFTQGRGKYEMYLSADMNNKSMSGMATIEKADIEALAALANKNLKFLHGELTSNIEFGGTLQNPTVRLIGKEIGRAHV